MTCAVFTSTALVVSESLARAIPIKALVEFDSFLVSKKSVVLDSGFCSLRVPGSLRTGCALPTSMMSEGALWDLSLSSLAPVPFLAPVCGCSGAEQGGQRGLFGRDPRAQRGFCGMGGRHGRESWDNAPSCPPLSLSPSPAYWLSALHWLHHQFSSSSPSFPATSYLPAAAAATAAGAGADVLSRLSGVAARVLPPAAAASSESHILISSPPRRDPLGMTCIALLHQNERQFEIKVNAEAAEGRIATHQVQQCIAERDARQTLSSNQTLLLGVAARLPTVCAETSYNLVVFRLLIDVAPVNKMNRAAGDPSRRARYILFPSGLWRIAVAALGL
ncbi:hypothetical protein NDU88_002339 [Pleurodeles waltl]|uniref:Uncharacterized protein n=1 Tax=Pleurodeles waltl TaxID=8319 RepID=A0AAV7P9D6_PLEWA|nr:hypothetical protein NDU88_002339 [Pleurodeles waltl]